MKEVKQREIERFLAAAGWRLARTKGGHNVWVSPDSTPAAAHPPARNRVAGSGPASNPGPTRCPEGMEVRTVSKVYEATATREGRWWLVRVPEVEGAVTQARHAREIAEMAAGLVQALLDLEEPPEVKVTIQLPAAVDTAWQKGREARCQWPEQLKMRGAGAEHVPDGPSRHPAPLTGSGRCYRTVDRRTDEWGAGLALGWRRRSDRTK